MKTSGAAASGLRAPIYAAALAVLFAHALVARWPLFRDGLWRDEAISVYIASAPSRAEFSRRLETNDYNPPLFHASLAAWGRLAGWGETSLKVYALGWGFLAFGALALLAGSLFGRGGALLALAFGAANPLLYRMSGELRPYCLSVFAAAVSVHLAWIVLRGPRPRPALTAFLAIALTMVVYSHYAGLMVLAAVGFVGVVGFVSGARRDRSLHLVVAAALAGAAFLPWAAVLARQLRIGIPYERQFPWNDRFALLSQKLLLALPVLDPRPGWLAAAGAAALLAVAFLAWAPLRRELRAAGLRLGLPFAAGVFVFLSMGLSANNPRYISIAAGLAAVFLAGVLVTAARAAEAGQPLAVLAAIAAIVFSLWRSYSALGAVSDWARTSVDAGLPRSAYRSLCERNPPAAGDLVVIAPDTTATTFWYYCGWRRDVHGFAQWEEPMLADWERYGRLWLSPTAIADALERVEDAARNPDRKRLVFLSASSQHGSPLRFPARIRELTRALDSRYRRINTTRYRGRLEDVERIDFALR